MANTPDHSIYYPTTSSSVLPATTDMKALAETTAAALTQVRADASYVRRALGLGENLNLLATPGIYPVNTAAIAGSLIGAPPGFSNPGTVEVRQQSAANGAYQQIVSMYWAGGVTRSFTRQSLSSVYPSTWESLAGWASVPLASSATLATLTTPSRYRANTGAIANTIIDRPYGVSNPFIVDVSVLSEANGVYLQELTEWTTAGPRQHVRVSLSGAYPAWRDITITPPMRNAFGAFGDSLTAGGGVGETWGAGETWPARMGTLLPGVAVSNYGRSGDTTDEVLIRMGVHNLYFSGTIPASGASTLSTLMKTHVPRTRAFSGSIAGIAGTLTFDFAAQSWTFARTTGGTAATLTSPTLFVSTQEYTRTTPLVFWAARNDWDFNVPGIEGSVADHILANHRKVLDFLPAGEKRVVFFGPTLNTAETVGTAGYIRVWALIDRMKYLYPGTFYCVMDYLIDHALADAGITPTAGDLAAIANREAPPSLFIAGDTTHFKKEIADVIGRNFAYPIIAAKGFVL